MTVLVNTSQIQFSIIIPSFNSGRYISETIESIISQAGNFEIECIFIDNSSVDNTISIIKKYNEIIKHGHYPISCNRVSLSWISEKDNGMYDAIKKGFSYASGNIFAWINSDDLYLPGAFNIIAKVFQKYPEINWLKGITSYINCESTIYHSGQCLIYNQQWIQKGLYGKVAYFIQQDSVFWRSSLWNKSEKINSDLKLAGDYDLWKKFSKNTPLYTVKAYISCFRTVDNQLSQNIEAYRDEVDQISPSKSCLELKIKLFFNLEHKIPFIFRRLFYFILFGKQQNFLIELCEDIEPKLTIQHYYIAE